MRGILESLVSRTILAALAAVLFPASFVPENAVAAQLTESRPTPTTTQPKIIDYQRGVRINWRDREVEVDGQVVLREGALELFACSPLTREHESIVCVDARPLHIYQALGLIGLNPGRPSYFDPDTRRYYPARGDPVEIEVAEASRCAGKAIIDMALPREVLITGVLSGDTITIPRGGTVLKAGDRVFLAGQPGAVTEAAGILSLKTKTPKTGILLGCGDLGLPIAQALEARGVRLTVFEKDYERSVAAASVLDKALVLHDEGLAEGALLAEGVRDIDLFIAATGDDPLNILAALQAKRLGAEVVVVHGETIVEPVAPGTNHAAIVAPDVDLLAHPGLLTPEDAALAAARSCLIEITTRKGHSFANGHVARVCRAAGAPLVVNSDSHEPHDLPSAQFARQVAAGAGLSLAVACDVRVASSAARFTIGFTGIGLVMDAGSSYFLPRLIGPGRTLDLAFGNRPIDAEEALRIGLVESVVAADEFEAHVWDRVKALAAGPTLSYALVKHEIRSSLDNTLAQQLAVESEAQAAAAASQDVSEGIDAFKSKRAPRFRGL